MTMPPYDKRPGLWAGAPDPEHVQLTYRSMVIHHFTIVGMVYQ